MSSVLVLQQRKAVHLLADAAVYDWPSGVLRSVNATKCIAMPTIMAAISCTGPFIFGPMFAARLAQEFSSFDDLISGADEFLPEAFDKMAATHRASDGAVSSAYIIGWSEVRLRAEAYSMDLCTANSTKMETLMKNSPNAADAQFGKLKQQNLAGTPLPSQALIEAAGLSFPDDLERVRPEIDLLHLMEIQRHEEIEGAHWVGGAALLTSVDQFGISQRVLHKWTEDTVGEVIAPLPINYAAWREERVMASAAIPEGLSRLQQKRMEKKARKGTIARV
jgi:hypothetical protein